MAARMAGRSSFDLSPFAPQSLTLIISLRRSGIDRAVGAPVAVNLKFVKVVSACAVDDGLNAKAPTALPTKNRLRWISFIVHHRRSRTMSGVRTKGAWSTKTAKLMV